MALMSSLQPRFTVFLLCLLVVLCSTSEARTCSRGTFDNGTTCAKCPRGTFQNKMGSTSCKKCPSGTFTPVEGVTSRLLCLDCPEDQTSRRGTGVCIPCPGGQVRGCRGECLRCSPGYELSGCECIKCNPDSIAPNANQRECEQCPLGQRANRARTACIDANCPDGTFFDFNECLECPFLSFRNQTMDECQPCPPRTTIVDYSKPKAACGKCPPGSFLTDIFVPTPEQSPVCENCPRGKTTQGFGKVVCRSEGEACPPDFFEDFEGDCEICPENFRFVPAKKLCVPCAEDEVSRGGQVKKCRKCPRGAKRMLSECRCPPGQFVQRGKCVPCPSGTSGPFGDCFPCSSSEESPQSSDTCIPCPPGTSSAGTDGRKCVPVQCPDGFVPPPLFVSQFPDNICISPSTGCPRRLEQLRVKFGTFVCGDKSGTVVCPKGTVSNGRLTCISCEAGEKIVENSNGILSCAECPRRTASAGGLLRKCENCVDGFMPNFRREKCVCPFRSFITKENKCERCPRRSAPGNTRLPPECPRMW